MLLKNVSSQRPVKRSCEIVLNSKKTRAEKILTTPTINLQS